jgi:hypothetical protein
MEIIYSPLNQLLIFLCVWLVNYVFKWRDEEYVIHSGFIVFAIWELIAALVSISIEIQWMYYLYLSGSLLVAYLVYIICIAVSDKWGNPYNGEGAIAMLMPVFMFALLMGPSVFIKLLVQILS